MKIEAAVIKEQGVTFAVVVVKKSVVDNQFESERVIRALMPHFGNIPVVLMGQDYRGRAYYRGRRDIVNFLSRLHISQIPWREYYVS
ncbi:hypothetical protein EDM57_04415 [Brevibacillus gelatini]|uniref:Uncharacterized protein n=1 Tax=Brevibacillus gelatini TaxID=1655277 RepID=A0A3M8B7V8_9BACL|nr:hypothetical protein [Brevibacillus gelatini]RNB59392.1 hypothetical protein EDM57_04415 [Brevibacillus gelatini]